MAIRDVVTRGYGNGTYNGTIANVVTRGYTIGAAVILNTPDFTVWSRVSPLKLDSMAVKPKVFSRVGKFEI